MRAWPSSMGLSTRIGSGARHGKRHAVGLVSTLASRRSAMHGQSNRFWNSGMPAVWSLW